MNCLIFDCRDTVYRNKFQHVNPFSLDPDGACKKLSKLNPISETFGKLSFSGEECASMSCHCNVQQLVTSCAPRRSRPCDGWSSCQQILHVRPTVTFKRNLVRKSKLGIVCASVRKEEESNKILKEPILKLANRPMQNILPRSKIGVRVFSVPKSADKKAVHRNVAILSGNLPSRSKSQELFGHSIISHQDFRSLLSLSHKDSSMDKNQSFSAASFHHVRANCRSKCTVWNELPKEEKKMSSEEKTCVGCVVKKLAATGLAHSNGNSSGGQSCSQQARMTASGSCDDVTIDELASYFDVFVHIPKKMSHMAEMMYI
jgi:hypothetical protein